MTMAWIAAASGLALSGALLARHYCGRARFCHFCGRDGRRHLPAMALASGLSWYCPHDDCGQYNGFDADGDYDRPLPELADPAYSSRFSHCRPGPFLSAPPVLCSQCQCEQGLLVRAVAHAWTTADAAAIARRYRLCSICREAVARRLQTVQRRIRVASTPLQISDSMKETAVSEARAPIAIVGIALLLEIALLAGLLLPPLVVVAADRPLWGGALLAWIAEYELVLLAAKLALLVSGLGGGRRRRRLRPVAMLAGLDLLLRLSQKGVSTEQVPMVSALIAIMKVRGRLLVGAQQHWPLALRCLSLLRLFVECLRRYRRRKSRRPPAQNRVGVPVAAAVFAGDHQLEDLRAPSAANVIADSLFKFSSDQLSDDFVAMEGARSCAVEDLFAGICISRSQANPIAAVSSEDRPTTNGARTTSSSAPAVACVFVIVAVLFVANARSSHSMINALYTGSLLVLLALGYRRPIMIPFTLVLLLRQWHSASTAWERIFVFLAQFGPDLAALLILGLTLLVDWNGVFDRLSQRQRASPAAIPEA